MSVFPLDSVFGVWDIGVWRVLPNKKRHFVSFRRDGSALTGHKAVGPAALSTPPAVCVRVSACAHGACPAVCEACAEDNSVCPHALCEFSSHFISSTCEKKVLTCPSQREHNSETKLWQSFGLILECFSKHKETATAPLTTASPIFLLYLFSSSSMPPYPTRLCPITTHPQCPLHLLSFLHIFAEKEEKKKTTNRNSPPSPHLLETWSAVYNPAFLSSWSSGGCPPILALFPLSPWSHSTPPAISRRKKRSKEILTCTQWKNKQQTWSMIWHFLASL